MDKLLQITAVDDADKPDDDKSDEENESRVTSHQLRATGYEPQATT